MPCAAVRLQRVPVSEDPTTSKFSLQNHELNKLLFFINYPICAIQM
jgi:hypothetical protein